MIDQILRQAAQIENGPSKARELWQRFLKKEITQEDLELNIAEHTADTLQDYIPVPYEPISKILIPYLMARLDGRVKYEQHLAQINGNWLFKNQEILISNRESMAQIDWAMNIPGLLQESKEKLILAINKLYANHDKHRWQDHKDGRIVQRLDADSEQNSRTRRHNEE